MVSRKVFAGNLRAERRTRKVGSGRVRRSPHVRARRRLPVHRLEPVRPLDKLLLRLFEEEEDLHIYILVDVSDSMANREARCRSCTTRCRSARR